jgi:protein-tyrosine phosphatase
MNELISALPTRVLPFKGTSNFRDLGGYTNTEGRSIRWGKLYRSGHLANLRNGDLRRLEQLQIHTLIDFRSRMERERDPDRLPPRHHIRVLKLPVLDKGNTMVQEVSRRLKTGRFAGFDADAEMAEAYRQFATTFVEQYRQFMRALLDANGAPVLWHCTAGKDRAGFAAALTLRLLGVSYPVVMHDYLLSGNYLRPSRTLLFLIRLTRGNRAWRSIRALMEVREHWMRGAFQAIDEQWGSFESYVEQGLALSRANIAQLRQALLAPPLPPAEPPSPKGSNVKLRYNK